MCAQASCVKQHLCTIPKFQFIYYYSLGHSCFGRCLATLKQLKARATGSLTEDMSLGKMLTVYMTLNWQNPDPNFLFSPVQLCSAFTVNSSGESFQSSVLLKRTRFLWGMPLLSVLWISLSGHTPFLTLPSGPFKWRNLKNFKYWWVVIYHVPLLN